MALHSKCYMCEATCDNECATCGVVRCLGCCAKGPCNCAPSGSEEEDTEVRGDLVAIPVSRGGARCSGWVEVLHVHGQV